MFLKPSKKTKCMSQELKKKQIEKENQLEDNELMEQASKHYSDFK